MNHKKEYRKLVETVKTKLAEQGKPCRNEDVAKALGYNRSYFSQLLGESGVITDDHIKRFKLQFNSLLDNITSIGDAPTESANVLTIIDKLATSMQKLADSRLIDSRTMEELVTMLKHERMPVDPLLQTDAAAETPAH